MQGFKKTHGLKFARALRRMGVRTEHTKVYHPRTSFAYKRWRAQVMRKNGGMCAICRSRKATSAHHKAMFSKNPDLRFRVSNGIPVCAGCHKKTRSFGGLEEDKG